MTVATILKTKGNNIVTANVGESVADTAVLLAKYKIGAVLVLDKTGKVTGVLSERDIVRALATSGSGCLNQNVEDLMTKDVICCAPSDTIDEVMALMTDRRIRHLPVMDGSELKGFISIGDVVKRRISDVEQEAAAMRDYIATG
ncbi:MAG: CBS domain-containing protein [Sneathiella sp.]|nr:CBS domain-containing protein [Sneathiella sp.]